MPSSGYIADSFVANEQPSTAKWNELWGNDASFNSGAGFNDAIILTRHFATSGLQLPDKTLNPYKFSVYRNAAWTSPAGTGKVPFDAKTFDTGSNFDVVTNNRFTAPIAGFYYFTSTVVLFTGGGTYNAALLYKNGSLIKTGEGGIQGATGGFQLNCTVNGLLQLAANDFIEVFVTTSASNPSVGAINTYFDGFLVSAT